MEGETFDLKVLGGFHLRRSGQSVDIPARKVACLLTYLACTAPGPHSREKLAALLWGSSNEIRARHNLRQALAKLRQILGPDVIVNENDSIRLSSGIVACDAVSFERLILEDAPSSLAAAVDLFKGAFLDDIYVEEEEWNDWLQIRRANYLENAINAMLKHGEHLLVAGDFAQALSLGKRAVELNRFREDAHRLVMRCFVAAGRTSEALAHYQELYEFLELELSVEPSDQTRLVAYSFDHQRMPLEKGITEASVATDHHSLDPPKTHAKTLAKDASERRNVTVIVCNFVRLTPSGAPIDPEDLHDIVSSFHKAVTDTVAKFSGYTATFSGNAVHVYFGYPRANSYDAAQAVRAGLAIVAHGRRLNKVGGIDFYVSAGISSGPVLFLENPGGQTSTQPFVVGEAPDIAARLQIAAGQGTVLVSNKTRLLLGEMFDFCACETATTTANLGSTVWKVISEKVGLSRFEVERGKMFAPIVGRDDELNIVNRLWDRAKVGIGQMALVTGEAGIGKSRLCEALVASVESGPHHLLRYQCSPHHAESAFHPVIQHLVTSAGITQSDSNDIRLDKLEVLMSDYTNGTVGDEAAVFAQLLGLEGVTRYGADANPLPQRRNRVLTTLVQQIERLALQKPVLWLVEDAHWIDPTTLELIDLVLEKIGGWRVLLIVTARPNFAAPLVFHPDVRRLTVGRLAPASVVAIVRQVAGDCSLPESLVKEILNRTDGNPLYVEEMTKAVIESGKVEKRGDTYILTRSINDLGVPATLHDSLMERLEGLSGVKELVQMAAVIGRTFDQGTLADLSDLPPQRLADALDRLVSAEIFFRTSSGNEATYAFKHALLRDAAYESMLRIQRITMHRRLYEVLTARGGTYPEIRAYHADIAGLPEAALENWEEAGGNAMARSAFKEAVAAFSAAIRLCDRLGKNSELAIRKQQLYVQMGQALIAGEGYADRATMSAFSHATELADAIGTPDLQLPALYGFWASRHVAVQDSADLAERFFRIANAQDDSGPQMVGLRMMALERFHAAHLQEALDLTNRSIALYRPQVHGDLKLRFGSDPRVAASQYRVWCLWHLGLADQAVEQMEKSLGWARASQHANTISLALHSAAVTTGTWLRLGEPAERMMRETLSLSEEMSLAHTETWGSFFLGLALHRQGKVGARELIEVGLERMRRNRDKRFNHLHFSCAAEVYADIGCHEEATLAIDQAFHALGESNDIIYAADLHRVFAKVLIVADAGNVDRAEACLREAIRIARTQGGLSLELRAATQLASLLAGRGEKNQAADLLRQVYGSFTEGFGTPDLLDATTMLGELQ